MDPKAAVKKPGSENPVMDSSTFLHHLFPDMDNPSVQQQHQIHPQPYPQPETQQAHLHHGIGSHLPHPLGDQGPSRQAVQAPAQIADYTEHVCGINENDQELVRKSAATAMMMLNSEPTQHITLMPRKKRCDQQEQGASEQRTSPLSISFEASRDTFRLWQIVKEERSWDDSQLAATLLECYESSLRRDVCLTCNSPLSRYCAKCFNLRGSQQSLREASPQVQPRISASAESSQHPVPVASVKEKPGESSLHETEVNESQQGGTSETELTKKHPRKKRTGFSMSNNTGMVEGCEEIKEEDKSSEGSQCQICDKMFASSDELGQHIAQHNGEVKWDSVRQYKTLHCQRCDKIFTEPDQLTWHMARHQADMRHQCKLCKARFFHEHMLALHAKIHIMQPLQVYCDYCKAPFATMYALRQHMRRQVCQKALATQQLQLQTVTEHPLKDTKGEAKDGDAGSTSSQNGTAENAEFDKPRQSSWTCHQCGDGFKSQCRLNRHLLIHSGEKEFGCQECGIGCSQLSHLVAHMKSHYRLRGFECRVCSRTFSDHASMTSHNCKPQVSALLGKPSAESGKAPGKRKKKKGGSKVNDSAKKHSEQIQEVPKEEKVGSNAQPQQTFPPRYEVTASCFGLETVQQSLGFEQGTDTDSLSYMSGQLPMPPMQAPVPVPVSDADLRVLETHFGEQKPNLAPMPQTNQMMHNVYEPVSDGPMRYQNAPPYPSQSYSQPDIDNRSRVPSLPSQPTEEVEEVGVVTKLHPFKCFECDKGFKGFQSMVAHTRSHPHPEHQCPHCSEGLPTAFSLSNHVCTIRSQKLFKCTVCGDLLRNSRNYRQHFRIHTGEKPYLCQICGRDFNSSSNFTIHLAIHKEQKRYQCPDSECSKAFSSKTNLNRHIMVHSGVKPHVCEVCGRGFSVPYRLTQHMRTHTGEKPYKCDQCGACFSCPGTLVGHKRVHTGEKPYKCEICGRGFALQRNRRSHYRTHRNRTA